MMWFDKQDQRALFGDRRSETVTVTDRSHREDGTRTLTIAPDMPMDFRALPFPESSFWHVAFDPPHLVRAGPRSWLAAKYGKLGADWRDDLRTGFAECFRVLKPNGTLVFKWNETQIKVREVLALTPEGYAVESSAHAGSVQIYPASALQPIDAAIAAQGEET